MIKNNKNDARSSSERGGSLRLWISLAVVFFILFMIGIGQWDFAVAGFIGLLAASGLSVLFRR